MKKLTTLKRVLNHYVKINFIMIKVGVFQCMSTFLYDRLVF